jgi:hypothetical protein
MEGDEKLLARMRATKSGWGQKDFQQLYISYGFDFREGRDRFYFHPKYPQLYAPVGRHNSLAKGYAAHAVRIIDRLKQLEEESDKKRRDVER